MTYAQFIESCELFEYSQEYYNLVKECAELQVIGRFLENQRFKAEEMEFHEGVEEANGGNYFMESVGDSEIVALEEAFKEKLTSMAGNVKEQLKKFWSTLVGFIKKIFKAVGNIKPKATGAAATVKEIASKMSKEQYTALYAAIGSNLQSLAGVCGDVPAGSVSAPISKKFVKNLLAGQEGADKLRVAVMNAFNPDTTWVGGCTPLDALTKGATYIAMAVKTPGKRLKEISLKHEAWSITGTEAELNAKLKEMEAVQSIIEDVVEKSGGNVQADRDAKADYYGGAAVASAATVNSYLSAFSKELALTMKNVNAVIKYKKAVLDAFETEATKIKSEIAASKEKKKEAPAEQPAEEPKDNA